MEEVTVCVFLHNWMHTHIILCVLCMCVFLSKSAKVFNTCDVLYSVCVCVCGNEMFWYAFVNECKYLVVFQVGEFPCSLTRCDSYNWVPFDFCRLEPRQTPPPLLFCHFLSSSQKWRELLGLFYCDLWVLSSTPICCLASDLDSTALFFLCASILFPCHLSFYWLILLPVNEPKSQGNEDWPLVLCAALSLS